MSELPSFLGYEMNQNLTRLSYVETALKECGFFHMSELMTLSVISLCKHDIYKIFKTIQKH
jgi:hypothetical protein